MTLSKEDAKLRTTALKHLSKAIVLANRAMRQVLYNRKARARDSIYAALKALSRAEDQIFMWQHPVVVKRRLP